jgi:CDP-L-myo-inositol myo-inositolphosphotransferase
MNSHTPRNQVSTAVIVAAGKGRRLRDGEEPPKPLTKIVGVPLIARVMANAAKVGIRHFVVVIGYKAELMRKRLPFLVPGGCELELVENPRFEEPNGVSLLSATQKLQEPFVLLMSDHLFSPERLKLALDHFKKSTRCLLLVEKKEGFEGDIEDATLVNVKDRKVKAISKGLRAYDAVDTGMFVLQPEKVTSALSEAGEAPSISDAMRVLGDAGELDALDISVGYWQDVDTPEDFRAAEQKLYRSLIKTTDGPLVRLINRRVSLFLSTRLWRFGITPNMVTPLTLVLGLLAGASFARGGGPGWALLGATLFQFHSIIDGVDGELARLLHKESRFGFWFDISVDNITHMAVFGGIALGQMADSTPGPWGMLGLFAVLGVALSFILTAPLLDPEGKNLSLQREQGMLRKLIQRLGSRDFTYLLFPLAVLGWLGGFLWVATIGIWVYATTVIFLRARARAAAAD